MEERKELWPEWETVRLIGRGSFGSVYEIQRNIFDDTEKAALKVITIPQNESDIEEMYSDGYDDESITNTFKSHLKSIVSEYLLMRKMNGCANIVNCDDVRYIQHDDGIGWDIYIKMELLTPLTKALPEDISEDTVVSVAKDMCTALELCRKHEIIHRDIKPQNIFVSENGDYKLGDFGIAKTVEKTMGGTKIGTYKYMAPEVYNNQPYGSGADIYSLGLVLYWMLNERRLPFLPLPPQKLSAGMDESARTRRFSGEPIPQPKHGSKELKEIVLKACAYDPKDRYQTAGEMLDALSSLGASVAPAIIATIEEETISDDIAVIADIISDDVSKVGSEPQTSADIADEMTVGPIWDDKNVLDNLAEATVNDELDDEATVGPLFVDSQEKLDISDCGDLKEPQNDSDEDSVENSAGETTVGHVFVDNKAKSEKPEKDDLISIGDWKAPAVSMMTSDTRRDTYDLYLKESLPEPEEMNTEDVKKRSEKIIAIIAVILLVGAVIISAIAFRHRCEYTIKKSDSTRHWLECECGEKCNIEAHTFTSRFDYTNHWLECDCGKKNNIKAHSYGEWEFSSAEVKDIKPCSDCGYKQEKDHVHNYYITHGGGSYHWQVCSSCGENTDIERHSFGSWVVVKAATESSTGTQERTCTICKTYKQTETIPVTHTHSYTSVWISNGDYHWHACSCGAKSNMSTHNIGSWTVTTAATCYATGTQIRKCTTCSYIQTQTISKKDHTEKTRSAVAATCTSSGLTSGKYCSVCGITTVSQSTVPAKGHNYTSGKCTRCGELKPSEGLRFSSNGDGTYSVSGIGTCADKNIVIPSTYNGKNVTKVARFAFCDCKSIKSVVIPNSVTSIDYQAFWCCTSLTSVTIPNSVTSIGGCAFADCTSLTSITIPNSVTSIGYSAFNGCTSLTSITIPNSVTSIGGGAFSCCTSLTSITIPNSVTSINWLSSCTSLTSITIPNSVTSIGGDAFNGCTSLTSITIPNSVTSIGFGAFQNCTSLSHIIIPRNVTTIEAQAFAFCTSLTSVVFENPYGWYVTETWYHIDTYVTVSNPYNAASLLVGEYCSSTEEWHRK